MTYRQVETQTGRYRRRDGGEHTSPGRSSDGPSLHRTILGCAPHLEPPARPYCRYREAVNRAVPSLPLRDKDRLLWGRSVALQLVNDLTTLFSGPSEPAKITTSSASLSSSPT